MIMIRSPSHMGFLKRKKKKEGSSGHHPSAHAFVVRMS
jgi:hypothetical protein